MSLRRVVALLGGVALLTFVAHAAASWLEAPASTFALRPYARFVFHQRIGDAVASVVAPLVPTPPRARPPSAVEIPRSVGAPTGGLSREELPRRELARRIAVAFTGEGIVAEPMRFAMLVLAPIAITTFVALALIVVLLRAREIPSDETARAIRQFGAAFAVVSIVALPVMSTDFWTLLARGRAAWWGVWSPLADVPWQAATDLPIATPLHPSTFGPLAIVLAMVPALLARASLVLGVVALKAIFAAAFIAMLASVDRLMATRGARARCVALVVAGWLPIGVLVTVADGRVEGVAAALVIAWLALRVADRASLAFVSLVAAVGIVPWLAPLVAIEAAFASRRDRSRSGIVTRWLATAAAFLLWAWSLRGTVDTLATWRDGAVALPGFAVVAALGDDRSGLAVAIGLVVATALLTIAIRQLQRRDEDGSPESLAAASLITLTSTIACTTWGVHPWTVLPLVPIAAVAHAGRLAHAVVGMAIAVPIPLVIWAAYPGRLRAEHAIAIALLAYGCAATWALLAPRLARVEPADG